ncbi:MAG: glycosyl hydrolase [Bacteroidota bacterium]|nr:glycosyl hydrolase [Bacteroidota bacterium]
MKNRSKLIFILFLSFLILNLNAQLVNVGSGGYTKTFPGTDAAGRNAIPSGIPQLTGKALGKPVPTSDWWSALVKVPHADNLFNYPYTLKTVNAGLVVSYIPSGVIDDLLPVTVGVTGINASKTSVSDYSDWTVTMNWNDGTHNFEATAGVGMPFLYFTKQPNDMAQVTVTSGTVTIANEMLVIANAKNGASFAVYAPAGSTWAQNAGVYTSSLNGKNYWSMAFIPLTATNVTSVANEYKKYAYVFPTNTTATYTYNESTSVVRTDFNVQTEVKEGTETNMLIGLLPHQWAHLAANSPVPDKYSYATVRGEMKTMAGNSFSVENTFHGILPTLPYVDNYSKGFTPGDLTAKITGLENTTLATWTDSYNEGQVMNQLMQTARVANEMGNTVSRDKILNTIQTRLENWLKADNGEVAFLFYYNSTWGTLIGYPAGYGSDSGINDHHFHWGYFIQAASFVAQFNPGWAAKWGGMVDLLIRDVAGYDRNDTMFPYLRNFSPYEGHSWADGFASNPQGNNQESSSESMNFSSSLIQWGQITGDKTIRDLGIYIYSTEQTGIEEYYMDTHHRNFPANQKYSLVSRVWANSNDNGTFWTGDIAASYGIEMYPIQGGSLYLGQDTVYVKRLWNEINANTGISTNQANPNLWHDVMWEYLAFIDPAKAIEMYNSYPDRVLKSGISDAQTYHWLHAMNALGRLDASVTANYPIAAAFILNGQRRYVAQNYSDTPITVTFSTGYQLLVPAGKMVTNLDGSYYGTITSSFPQAFVGGSTKLNVTVKEGTPAKVEFMDGITSLGTVTAAPFTATAANLQLGIHNFYAKIYDGDKYNVTNTVQVQVGNQLPYGGTASAIPGTIEAGNYDVFEGGVGQNIAYFDVDQVNAGTYRTNEYVDATNDATEGATVGWIASGEWLEYTVHVAQSGLYSFAFRSASGNVNGGGPFHLELDGRSISSDISVPSTSATAWDVWGTTTVSGIPFTQGDHVLRVVFSAGEFNFGKMTFTRTGDIPYSFPVANAGTDLKVVLPLTSATLDGSASSESGGKALTYKWRQVYGPTVIQFSDSTIAKPTINGLAEGMYRLKLVVTNPDLRSADDEMQVMVTSTDNVAPTVSLTSPVDQSTFIEGKPVTVSANASDFDGTVRQVDFYQNNTLISSVTTPPYTIQWNPTAGNYAITAKATDNGGAISTSPAVNVTISPVQSCTTTSTEASQGSFNVGYKCTFETVGTNVNITFELLDDKTGAVAYLWKETPFSESAMVNTSGKIFTTTISGQTSGSTISYACKFAYSGGLSVTKYLTYVVGTNCGNGGTNDTQAPSGFTASIGAITGTSVELLLNATDNSGTVVYNATYGTTTKSVSALSGVQKSLVITALNPGANYTFNIYATDLAGNAAANNPIILTATTGANTNTDCGGTASDAAQGSFTAGYAYAFQTVGSDVNISFELLDAQTGVIAYLWNYTSGFSETSMSNVSGKKFAIKLTGKTAGTTVQVACKFAFAGGMSVTKTFSYTVGNNCIGTDVESPVTSSQFFFPNPVQNILHLQLTAESNRVVLMDMMGRKVFDREVPDTYNLDMSNYGNGIYLIRVENKQGIMDGKVMKK